MNICIMLKESSMTCLIVYIHWWQTQTTRSEQSGGHCCDMWKQDLKTYTFIIPNVRVRWFTCITWAVDKWWHGGNVVSLTGRRFWVWTLSLGPCVAYMFCLCLGECGRWLWAVIDWWAWLQSNGWKWIKAAFSKMCCPVELLDKSGWSEWWELHSGII